MLNLEKPLMIKGYEKYIYSYVKMDGLHILRYHLEGETEENYRSVVFDLTTGDVRTNSDGSHMERGRLIVINRPEEAYDYIMIYRANPNSRWEIDTYIGGTQLNTKKFWEDVAKSIKYETKIIKVQ